jgi:copper chaperone CopZ
VRSALSRLPGVLQVSPSAERNEVRVSYDENQVDEKQLRARLAEIGYDALP